MNFSSNNQKRKLHIAITATVVLALLVIAFFVLTPKKSYKAKSCCNP